MTKDLCVLIGDVAAGSLVQDARGKLRFVYDQTYRAAPNAVPLSISMPLAVAEHDDRMIRPFIWGLLPDNDDTLGDWGRRFGVNPRNPFALIGEVGEDLQGAVQIVAKERYSVSF